MMRMIRQQSAVDRMARALPGVATVAKAEVAARSRPVALDVFGRVRQNAGLAGIYLFLGVMVVFALFPIYFVLQASLNATQALISTQLQLIPTRPTLDNYRFVLQQEPFVIWMRNSILVCTVATIIALVCCTTGAYALSRFRFRGRRLGLLFLIGLQAFPGLLAIYAYYSILSLLHLDGQILGLAIVYASTNLVFGVWNIKGYFDTIPIELEEAALVDGASYFTIFVRI
ncbi:MAG TPA: ABC transporter permease subunit, partial [Ktedonobacterales bacterium]|nr:ABC transporter permease subunit [Ktedonobacterales bacterium]